VTGNIHKLPRRSADLTLKLFADFLRFKLTGELGTDGSDAASSGLFDAGQRVWADGGDRAAGAAAVYFPQGSADVVGPLNPSAAAEFGLPHKSAYFHRNALTS
jgi:sugar (pentulose or hexulose) kinase